MTERERENKRVCPGPRRWPISSARTSGRLIYGKRSEPRHKSTKYWKRIDISNGGWSGTVWAKSDTTEVLVLCSAHVASATAGAVG